MAKERELYLRHPVKGTIYGYSETMERVNPTLELVTKEEAFPAKYAPPHVDKARIGKIKGKAKYTSKLDLETAVEKPNTTSDDLAAEAGRGWPKK